MKSADDAQLPLRDSTHHVRIDALVPADSPRLNGIDTSHVRRLAAIYPSLPPVLVHRPSMRVVDGMHRISAATSRGLDSVTVQFFDGDEDQVFLRSVAANVAHGLPLSVAERKTAAARILTAHPSLSDRAVASYAGLDAKTVAGVRECSAAGSPPLNVRTGADGKVHPLDRTAERMHAAKLMTKDPGIPLRTVVKETGLSLGTAHDVRRRLLRGEDPVPRSQQAPQPATSATPAPDQENTGAASGTPAPPHVPRQRERPLFPRSRAPLESLRRLANDPSLRHSESGREFIRWIRSHLVLDDAWRKRADAVPPHSTDAVAELALHCSEVWRRFAEDLARRRHSDTRPFQDP